MSLKSKDRDTASSSSIIIDTVHTMSGMESLVVFGVGLDEKIKKGDKDEAVQRGERLDRMLINSRWNRLSKLFSFRLEPIDGIWVPMVVATGRFRRL